MAPTPFASALVARGRAAVLGALLLPGCSSGGAHASPTTRVDGGQGGAGAASDSGADSGDATALAAEAFVWGFPLVVSRRTFQTFAPLALNHLYNQTALTPASLHVIPSPNQDTLYSISVLDLRSEPMVMTVPDVTNRYWTYQFLEPWTNSFHYVGTRATSGKGGTFVITPPGYAGSVPATAERIESPTPLLFLLGRFLVKDAADVPNVTGLDRTVVPLHQVTGDAAPSPPPPLGGAPAPATMTGLDGAAFFDELGDALAEAPPYTAADEAALARYAALGIGPGLHPAADARAASGDAGTAMLDRAAADGLATISNAGSAFGPSTSGWSMRLDIGTYEDPLLRAVVAKGGWAANVPEEAVYAHAGTDGTGQPLSGTKNYSIHFAAGGLPKLRALGFWSITLYGPDHFFVENSIHRYAIGDRTPNLAFNADGSLDLYVQDTAPTGHETNWLPAPAGPFELVMRLYLPDQPILDGTYVIPPVVAE